MPRLIDADGLKKLIIKKLGIASKKYLLESEKAVFEQIDDAPTVDAVPVRHGKWNCGDDMFEYAICSACKWDSGEAWEYAKKNFIYCPNCGARMDEE